MLMFFSGLLTENWQLMIMCFVFIAIGLFIIIGSIRRDYKRKRCFTERVVAVCTHIDTKRTTSASGNSMHTVHCPHYSFEYQGKHYYVHNDSYSNISVPELGAAVYLRINPENPEQFYRESSGSAQFSYVIGILVLLFGIMGLRSLIQ